MAAKTKRSARSTTLILIHDPGNRAGPLSRINFSCVHMAVFIPPTGMKFDIDWYVYLKVWKINYVIPSTHAQRLPRSRLAGQPGYRDQSMLNFIPVGGMKTTIWTQEKFIPLSGPARLLGSCERPLKRKFTTQTTTDSMHFLFCLFVTCFTIIFLNIF